MNSEVGHGTLQEQLGKSSGGEGRLGKLDKILERVLQGTADANIRFDDLVALLRKLGFEERIRGDHHIFSRSDVEEILNLQPRGGQAKPYQVKQVRMVILKYRLSEDERANADETKANGLKETDPSATGDSDAT